MRRRHLEEHPDGTDPYLESQGVTLPCPRFPFAALIAATAISHSDALAIGVRPALAHVAPSVVRTT